MASALLALADAAAADQENDDPSIDIIANVRSSARGVRAAHIDGSALLALDRPDGEGLAPGRPDGDGRAPGGRDGGPDKEGWAHGGPDREGWRLVDLSLRHHDREQNYLQMYLPISAHMSAVVSTDVSTDVFVDISADISAHISAAYICRYCRYVHRNMC